MDFRDAPEDAPFRQEVRDFLTWQPVPMSRGVWIRGDTIRTIEFMHFEE
jgi:hypothetical protein